MFEEKVDTEEMEDIIKKWREGMFPDDNDVKKAINYLDFIINWLEITGDSDVMKRMYIQEKHHLEHMLFLRENF